MDVLTATAFLALAAWSTAAQGEGGAPWRLAVLVAGIGAVYGLSRAVTNAEPLVVPLAVVAVGVLVAVVRADVLVSGPLDSPLGYANASGSFFALVSAAGFMAAARMPHSGLRWAAAGVAVAAAAIPWLSGAHTAAALALLPPLALVARPLGIRVRGVIGLAAVLVLGALAFTVLAGATFDGQGAVDRAVAGSLSARRPQLWGDALDLVATAPVKGVGLGGFARLSPTALSDRDARWAHNEYLQLAAETGVPGGLLAVLITCCVLARLWIGPRDEATGAAAVAVAALSVAASVDYVLHFALVGLTGAAVAGAALARAHQPSRLRAATSL